MANRNAVSAILKTTDFARHICCQAGSSQGSNTKLLLDQLVLEAMDGPAQLLGAQAILLFHSSWRKEFFPTKELLSSHRRGSVEGKYELRLDQFE